MLPLERDSRPPPIARKPWANTWRGSSTPAAINIAGQTMQWKRVMSLPMTWTSQGHHFLNFASSVPNPTPVT